GAPYEQGIAAPPADAVPATARWQPRLPTTRLWAGCSEPLRPAWRHSARPARFGQTGCNTGGGHNVAAEKQPGQVGSPPTGTGPMQSGDQANRAALPPEVRPEGGPRKELAPRFARS